MIYFTRKVLFFKIDYSPAQDNPKVIPWVMVSVIIDNEISKRGKFGPLIIFVMSRGNKFEFEPFRCAVFESH